MSEMPTFQTVRSCVYLIASLGPIVAAIITARRLASTRGPAGAGWLLVIALVGNLLGDALQMLAPRILAQRGGSALDSWLAVSVGIDCGCEMPLMLLAAVALLMMKPTGSTTLSRAGATS